MPNTVRHHCHTRYTISKESNRKIQVDVEAKTEEKNVKEERNEIILYRFQNHIIFFCFFKLVKKTACALAMCVCVWCTMCFKSMLFPLLHVSFIKFSFCTPSFHPYSGLILSLSLSLCRLAIFIILFVLLFFFY